MANICDQNLYIVAATEDDMKSLLAIMASNFEKTTRINPLSGSIASADWRQQASAIANRSTDYNKLCFLAKEPDTRSEAGYVRWGLIDGKPYIALDMGLKWGPSFQPQEFCKSLDASKYGCACINGGEYMCAGGEDCEIAYIQWGEDFGDPFSGGLDCGEFIELSKKTREEKLQDLHHLALRELFECEQVEFFFWETSKAYGYGDEYASDESFLDDSNDMDGSWAKINWRKPSEDDLEQILPAVIDMLAAMPFVNTVSYGWTKEGNKAIEKLLPGDVVTVSSKWSTDYVELKVSTLDGKQIGCLGDWYDTQIECDQETATRIIALVLPYARATVHELNPLSLRNAGVKNPEMSVRFDAIPIDLGAIIGEVRTTLEKNLPQRALSSDVKGAM